MSEGEAHSSSPERDIMTSKLFTTITGFDSTSDSPYLPDPAGELSLTAAQREQMNAEAKISWSEQANEILAPHGLTLLGDGEILQDVDDARPDALRTQLEEDGETLGAWLSEQIELPAVLLDRWLDSGM